MSTVSQSVSHSSAAACPDNAEADGVAVLCFEATTRIIVKAAGTAVMLVLQ